MFRQSQNENFYNVSPAVQNAHVLSKSFLSNVFSWMFGALVITALIAYYFANTPSLLGLLVTETGMSTLGWVVTFAPIGFVLLMSFGYHKLSSQALVILFLVFGALMGMSLSFIFLVYTSGSIFITFTVTSLTFGLMALLGYTTKTDLSKFGSFLMMALFGIIIASLVNFFMKSETLDYIISIIGVLVFTGLTAYDVQKLKRIGANVEIGTESTRKATIMGAMTLYLDFINLFLFLLRFLGDRK